MVEHYKPDYVEYHNKQIGTIWLQPIHLLICYSSAAQLWEELWWVKVGNDPKKVGKHCSIATVAA